MSLYLGENCISAGGSSAFKNNNIGEIIQSTIPLTDAGLHLLDGSLISGSGAYADFVTYISGLVTDYPDLFETEANWQQSVTDYGVCGKFVYDSVNNTVRLPKITGFTEGTIDPTVLGDLTEAGLPNIDGRLALGWGTDSSFGSSGAFYRVSNSTTNIQPSGSGTQAYRQAFSASRSSSIYGNSTTVQPQAIKVLYYIVIATSTKTEIEVDIDEIATDLNGKADVDLNNVLSNIDYVVESKTPTSADPSWYRVYKSGWVEQGGTLNKQTIAAGSHADQTLVFPKQMADTNYTITFGAVDGNSRFQSVTIAKTTTGGTVSQMDRSGSGSGKIQFSWHASGQGA